MQGEVVANEGSGGSSLQLALLLAVVASDTRIETGAIQAKWPMISFCITQLVATEVKTSFTVEVNAPVGPEQVFGAEHNWYRQALSTANTKIASQPSA